MRAIFTSGSVGRAPGNRCLYPETEINGFVKCSKVTITIRYIDFDRVIGLDRFFQKPWGGVANRMEPEAG